MLRRPIQWARSGPSRVFLRWNSDTYLPRKQIIAENPPQYYPSISEVRQKYIEKAPVASRVPQFCAQFRGYDFSKHPQKRIDACHKIEGRIALVRRSGRGIYFLDLVQDGEKLQLMAHHKLMELSVDDFDQHHSFLRSGDYVVAVGFPSTTNVGELTLKLNCPIELVSPCLNLTTIPEKLSDRSLINKNRVLDYIVSPELREHMVIRSLVIQAIRSFFLQRQYLEVQTPLLAGNGTGANAQPFKTTLRALGLLEEESLSLRVAPELWLKRLVISGFDKVFEIGPSFRNEGVDATHNPEFYTCEFYQLFLSLEELMEITQDLFAHIHSCLSTHRTKLKLLDQHLTSLEPLASKNFRRYEFIPTIQEITGHPFPKKMDSNALVEYFHQIGAALPSNKSPASLLDELSSLYLEPLSLASKEPVIFYNQPAALSPLAKSTTRTYNNHPYEISSRFELFIDGKEYVNSYEEENSPFAQVSKFKSQQAAKLDHHDPEALVPDWQYARLMEYGLPPTGGWGCGIDRLVMLFSGASRISQVLPFGTIRDVVRQ